MLERAKSSIFPNGNFRDFFLWRGGNFAFSKREFPVALMAFLALLDSFKLLRSCTTNLDEKPNIRLFLTTYNYPNHYIATNGVVTVLVNDGVLE